MKVSADNKQADSLNTGTTFLLLYVMVCVNYILSNSSKSSNFKINTAIKTWLSVV